jgi:N-hydroxyarylamine O-acetyltransferase
MDVDKYLDRINYRGSLVTTAETLRALQEAHLLAVPFENLSIHLGEPIVLENGALFDKVVNRRRGGFCYELNGLF